MARFTKAELDDAFVRYWRTGAVGEDWNAWVDLFTDDCAYVEHFYGTMRGRATIRAWIVPVMEKYREIYTVYEWHTVDPDSGRVIFRMQNRRDHPGGGAPIDFPGVTILQYAGDGKWSSEEDYYAIKPREVAMAAYAEACATHDPAHPQKGTRGNWGDGPAWTRGGPSYAERPAPPR